MRLWCIKNGIREDTAEALNYWELMAHSIVFSELDSGKVWDWGSHSYVNKE